ncbi:preprotein translocase subunit YajC [Endozoicomonas sp. SM1973]|uniref:Sec translocon accessory complex subunit YajC n=1 Tax=Spartinivicinus marinus TaxID=2994442 RepID=A0A853I6K4_9GAMM|nr:preprotein translocase subunit YajC [Spartinivicinus marinus]MCX4025574.1 preprotein translocase subunit YajC [Spartinivicinus marinus]NYZ65197.1 preprotein translocase subunit YajC [Spartinivicinus marinus]
MSFFINEAFAAPAAAAQGGGMIQIGMLVLMVAVFYFLLIRPQKKRMKEHQQLVENLNKGDEVVTNGGIVGKVTKVSEQFVTLQVSNNVELNFQKQAISAVLPKGTIKAI